MAQTVPLLRRRITLEAALQDEDNILHEMAYPEQRVDFFFDLLQSSSAIEAVAAYHLHLKDGDCTMAEVKEWLHGSFNVCIPIYVKSWENKPKRRVLMRFPLPYKVGEFKRPGNAEEKLRCEAATFLWIQENCPDVPIPYLFGFGFPDGQSFTAPEKTPFFSRIWWSLRRAACYLFGKPTPCRYVGHRCPQPLQTGYLIMDLIEESEGKMLSSSWEELRHDETRRRHLFRGMSKIILSMAKSTFSRIGSLTVNNYGVLSLTNRPLTLLLHQLENEGTRTNIDRTLTYHTSDAYMSDLLACHDSRLRHRSNSMQNEEDGEAQQAVLTIMRAFVRDFTDRDLRQGPFILSLTDLHQSNVFIDDDWNVKYFVDLEWACSRPLEMQHPPHWLTSRGVDELRDEHLLAFAKLHSEFCDIFEEQEELGLKESSSGTLRQASIMRRGLENGSLFYSHALESPKGLFNLFLQHIQPRYASLADSAMDHFETAVAPFWSPGARDFRSEKLKDKEEYERKLQETFAEIVRVSEDTAVT